MIRRWLCVTPRDSFLLTKDTAYLDYGIFYSWHVLIFVVVLSYSVIAPIILLPGSVYFLISFLVYRYQLLFVYIKHWEAFGRHFVMAYKRSLFGLGLFQVTLVGMFSLKSAPVCSALMIPLLPLTLLFYLQTRRAFERRTKYVPLDQEEAEETELDLDIKVFSTQLPPSPEISSLEGGIPGGEFNGSSPLLAQTANCGGGADMGMDDVFGEELLDSGSLEYENPIFHSKVRASFSPFSYPLTSKKKILISFLFSFLVDSSLAPVWYSFFPKRSSFWWR